MRSRSDRHQGSPYAGLAAVSVGAGLLFGLGAFVVSALLMGFDYFAVRDSPTEHAVVLSVTPSGTEETCGRAITPNTPGERTTYRSSDPPRGLPAEFSVTHCPDWDDHPGDTVTVRRTGTSQDDVYVDPIETAGQWLGMAALVGAGTALICALGVAVKEAWGIHRSERRRQARNEEPAG